MGKMTTLTNLVQQIASDLGVTDIFTATGAGGVGKTTTVAGNYATKSEPPDEDFFKDNYIVCTKDAGGAGAAPEGSWGLISAYAQSTTIITHSALSAATATDDEFIIYKQNNFSLLELIAAINRALKRIGLYTFTDTTSITIATNQTEYSLPSGIQELLSVEIQQNDDSNDNRWRFIYGWRIIPAAVAMTSEPLLYIPQQTTGWDIKLTYNGYHPTLVTYDDVVQKWIPEELLIAGSKVALLESYISSKSGAAKPYWGQMYAEALRQYNEARVMFPIHRIARRKRRGIPWPTQEISADTDDFKWPD
jgi:hypothetical protein